MQVQQYSLTNIVIFHQQITINVNIGSNLIDELNMKCDKLVTCIEYEIYNDIDSNVIDIIVRLKQIIKKTQASYLFSDNSAFYTEDSYFKAIKSSLWFLEYINNNILELNNFKNKIYIDFYNIIKNEIDKLIYDKNRFFFDWKLYEWLIQEKHIDTRYDSKYEPFFSKTEIEDFGKLEYKNIIANIIQDYGDISNVKPFKSNKELAFRELYICFFKLNIPDFENTIGDTKCKEN